MSGYKRVPLPPAKIIPFKIPTPKIDIFYKYLAHLKDVGIDNELIKIFNSIYLPTENQNPVHLIKTIREDIKDDISYKVFKKEYKINE